jgi:5-methylcytosine-specific restriction endonuclease McrA
MAKPAYDRQWQRVRRMILVRDSFVCQIRDPGCTRVATTVDHIVELAAGGARLDPGNLRAACRRCNSSRGAAFGNRKREPRSEAW